MPHLLGFLDQRIAQRQRYPERATFAMAFPGSRFCTIADRLLQRLLPILKPYIIGDTNPRSLVFAPLAQEQQYCSSYLAFIPGRFFLGAKE